MDDVKDAEPFEANCCRMPTVAPKREANAYIGIRNLMMKSHCADKRPAHKCCGTVSIDRDSITLQCPRCGDAKKIFPTS